MEKGYTKTEIRQMHDSMKDQLEAHEKAKEHLLQWITEILFLADNCEEPAIKHELERLVFAIENDEL